MSEVIERGWKEGPALYEVSTYPGIFFVMKDDYDALKARCEVMEGALKQVEDAFDFPALADDVRAAVTKALPSRNSICRSCHV